MLAIVFPYYVRIAFQSFFIVGDFVRGNGVYEDIVDFQALKTFMEERLEDFNMEPGVIAMDLVLFRDAIEHGTLYIFHRSK